MESTLCYCVSHQLKLVSIQTIGQEEALTAPATNSVKLDPTPAPSIYLYGSPLLLVCISLTKAAFPFSKVLTRRAEACVVLVRKGDARDGGTCRVAGGNS